MRSIAMEPALSEVPTCLWERAAAAPARVVLLDYDGTLAPFRVERDRAFPLPDALDALARVAQSPGTKAVVISGRPLPELQRLLGPLPVELVGEHGWEEWSAGGGLRLRAVPSSVSQAIDRAVAAAAAHGFGARLEIKRCSVVLHTRGLPEAEAKAIEEACRGPWAEEAATSRLRLDPINGGLELRATGEDKGIAVRDILAHCSATTFPVYIGDDATDEDAFREVTRSGGYCLRVGRDDRPTLAQGHLPSCEAVAAFLYMWWRVIEGGSTASRRRTS